MKHISIILFLTILCVFCVTPVNSIICMNYFCNNLVPECPLLNSTSTATTQDVFYQDNDESFTILQAKAAATFLKAHGIWNEFLVKIEMMDLYQRFDYNELNNILKKTVLKIDEAENIFTKICITSRQYQVNPTTIEKLKSFDYKWFCVKSNLNPAVMSDVECKLNTGDILGIPNRFREQLAEIKVQMESFRQSIEKKELNIDHMYIINNELLSLALFGQYTAMIFREVRLQ